MADIILKGSSKQVKIVGFEHLHLHTDFSLLDGMATIHEISQRAPQINQKFLTVTDHGMLGAVPQQIKACDKINDKLGKDTLSPIYGCEFYVNKLQPESTGLEFMQKYSNQLTEDEQKELRPSYHLLAIAYNEQGYKNLVKLSSWGWTKGFYRRPRINHEQLVKHKEGLYFTSCCYNSEVGKAFDRFGEEAAFQVIENYIEMFGKDHYFLEIMLLDFSKQKPYDKFIIKAHEKYGLKLIITNDVHYCLKEDSHYQRLMLMVQTGRTIEEINQALAENSGQDFFELQDSNLWMKSEEELNEKWLSDYQDIIPYELFQQAKMNTVEICQKAKGVQLDRSSKLPELPDANAKLKEEIIKGFQKRGISKHDKTYQARIEEEYSMITRKGFASYFLIQKMMTDEARRVCKDILGFGDGSQAIGPGRGCLDGNTLIVTENGNLKKIKDIVIGDKVYTQDASLQVVEKVFRYEVDEDLLVIRSFWNDDTHGVALTKDHKVLVSEDISKNEENLIWKRADEVLLSDYLFVPKINGNSDTKSMNKAERMIEDYLAHKSISFSDVSLEKICHIRHCLLLKGYLSSFCFNSRSQKYYLWVTQGYEKSTGYFSPVRSIEIKKGVKEVFDLQVANNHNYLTSSFLVHNSAVGALTCYLLYITNVDPVYEDLLFSRFMSEARGGRSIELEFKNIDPLPPEEVFND